MLSWNVVVSSFQFCQFYSLWALMIQKWLQHQQQKVHYTWKHEFNTSGRTQHSGREPEERCRSILLRLYQYDTRSQHSFKPCSYCHSQQPMHRLLHGTFRESVKCRYSIMKRYHMMKPFVLPGCTQLTVCQVLLLISEHTLGLSLSLKNHAPFLTQCLWKELLWIGAMQHIKFSFFSLSNNA